MQRVAVALEGRVAAVHSERVLQQVVRAEAREPDLAEPAPAGQDGRRDLEHRPEADLAERDAVGTQAGPGLVGQRQEGRDVARVGDHRGHHLDRPGGAAR